MAKRNGIEFDVEEGVVIITFELPKVPGKSKEGKSFLLASTKGNWNTGEEAFGEEIILGFNMYIPVTEDSEAKVKEAGKPAPAPKPVTAKTQATAAKK